MSDTDLVQAMYEQYVDAIYRFCYWQTNRSEDAEDLTADIMLDMAKNIRQFRGDSSFKNWLYAIAKNHLARWIRKKYELPLLPLQDNAEYGSVWIDPVEQDVARKKVAALFSRLAPRERAVLELRYLKGYSVKETAKELKLSEPNIKVLTHRALVKLRKV